MWFADKEVFPASAYLMTSRMDLLLEFRALPYNSTYSPPHETNDVLVSQVVPRSRRRRSNMREAWFPPPHHRPSNLLAVLWVQGVQVVPAQTQRNLSAVFFIPGPR